MSTEIDQSLDDIIKTKTLRPEGQKKSAPRKAAASAPGRSRGRSAGIKKAATPAKPAQTPAAGRRSKRGRGPANGNKGISVASSGDLLANARRVLVSGMPRDVTSNQVREFFANHVGVVSHIQSHFTSDGQSAGNFTVTFKAHGDALKTFQSYNGTPIDGGQSKLRVQILVDQEAANAPRPLAERLNISSKGNNANAATPNNKKNAPKSKPIKTAKTDAKPVAGKSKRNSAPKRPQRRTKKSAAELDAEMADYFAAPDSGNNEISV